MKLTSDKIVLQHSPVLVSITKTLINTRRQGSSEGMHHIDLKMRGKVLFNFSAYVEIYLYFWFSQQLKTYFPLDKVSNMEN